jgi:hypothetical protein
VRRLSFDSDRPRGSNTSRRATAGSDRVRWPSRSLRPVRARQGGRPCGPRRAAVRPDRGSPRWRGCDARGVTPRARLLASGRPNGACAPRPHQAA